MASQGWAKTKVGPKPTPEYATPDIDAFAAANASKTLSKFAAISERLLTCCRPSKLTTVQTSIRARMLAVRACLDDNLYDRNKCIDFFLNMRDCKQYVADEMAKRKWGS